MKAKIKAVSPLIATVLLVAVALAIAGILYAWSGQYTARETSKIDIQTGTQIDCSYAKISVSECSYDSTAGISLFLDNIGTVDLNKGFKIILIDSQNNLVEGTIEEQLSSGDVKPFNSTSLNNSSEFKNLTKPFKKIRIVPLNCPEKVNDVLSCN